ncbi:MAG: hypothetical protein ABIJ44_06300 [Pseudomonadota bacterium]
MNSETAKEKRGKMEGVCGASLDHQWVPPYNSLGPIMGKGRGEGSNYPKMFIPPVEDAVERCPACPACPVAPVDGTGVALGDGTGVICGLDLYGCSNDFICFLISHISNI